MTAVALVRAPFRPLAIEDSWDESLLQMARQILGYNPSIVGQRELSRTRNVNEGLLAQALERAAIEPFTIASVEAYKHAKAQEALKNQAWPLTRYMHDGGRSYENEGGEKVVCRLGIPAWIATGAATLLCAIGRFAGTSHWGWDGHKSIEITNYMSLHAIEVIMALPLTAVAAWSFLMYLRHKKAIGITANWNDVDVQRYNLPIPAFAVQRMLTLKQELPEVTFSVQQMDVQTREIKTRKHLPSPPPDPFLVASFRAISCYVDVWDEPKFEGRRTR